MADSISFGNKGNAGKIDLSKVKAGVKKEDIVGQNKQLESIFDSVDKDGNQVLDRNELQDLQTKLTELAGDDARLSKGEAKKFIGNDGKKLGGKNRDALFEFLNKLSAGSQDVKSITTQNIDGQDVEVITYNDGHTEELYPDGTKITMITNGNKSIVTKEDKDGNKLSQTEKTIEDGVETVVEYDGETPKSKTVNDTKNNTISTYTFDGETPVLVREENTETGDVTTYENGVKTTTKADGQIITEQDGITTTTSADGNIVTTTDGTRTETRVRNSESETLTTVEDGVETVVTQKDGKNLSQTITKDGESFTVEYDGNGNTKGVIVQNGESPAAIAKKFGCSVKDLMEANKEVLKGKKYFQVGAEIVIPGEMNPEEFAKLNAGRQTAEEAKAQYAYEAQIRAERRAAAAAQEKAEMQALGIVNRNNAGTVINSETKPTEDGKFKNFNKNAAAFRKLTFTVVGETGNRGRMVVKASNGKYYTMAHDGMLLDEGYAIATKALDAGQAASRNDGHGRKVVVVDGKQYVFSQDGKLLKSDYVEATDIRDAGGAKATVSGDGVTFVKGEDGTIRYFDKNGKLITGAQRKQLIQAESQKAADIIYKAAHGLGTDEEKLTQGVNMIYSPEIMAGVNTILKSKDSDYAGDAQTTPLEALLLDELSRSEVRQHIKTLAANGAYGTGKSRDAALGRNAAREIQYEVHGGVFGYTGTADLKEAMGVASTRGARLATEEYFQDGKVKGGANEGSMVRQYIAEDGWNAQEVDQFDATWIKNNAYDSEHDQAHRNSVVGRLVFDYDSDEALHTGLDAVDSNPDSEDYKYLTQRAVEANKANGYRAHFTDQEAVQTYLAGRTANEDGSVDAAHVSACNTLLFKGEKPARVQAEEILYDAQNGDMSTMFDSMDPKVYTAMADLIAKGDVKGCTSVKEAYDKVMSETTNINDKTKIKANAILSGQVEFSDAEIADFCVELMHRIDKNRGEGGSTGISAEHTNIADYETEQLKAILQANPQVAAAVKEKVQADEFSYTVTITTSAGQGPATTTSLSHDTKADYLNILSESRHVVSEAVFLDAEGKQITDPAQIKALTEANMNALKDMREYVAQLEREFKKGVDAEGAFSDAANWLSTYSGLGTDRSDVATEYRNAKLLLNQLEAAAQGKLRDSEGNVVSAQDLAQSIIDKENSLAQTNADYTTTIQTAKMGMILAPVILVTTVATAGTGAGFWTGAAIAGAATAGTEYGLNTIERVTSITGDTAEAREEHAISAMVDGASTFIGVGQMKFIPKILNNAGTFVRAGGRLTTVLASDIGVGAAGEYVQTGTVTVNGVAMNAVFSATGNLIGLRSLSEKHIDVSAPHIDANLNGRDIIADGEVARNIDLQHVDANQRRMVEEGLKDVPTPEELAAYQREIGYQSVPEADRPAFEAHQQQVAADYANAHRIENNAVIIETPNPKAPKEAADRLADEIRGLDGNIRRVRQQMEGARRFGKDTSRYEQQLKNLEAKRAAKQAELDALNKPAAEPEVVVKAENAEPVVNPNNAAEVQASSINDIQQAVNNIDVEIPSAHKELWNNCKNKIDKIIDEIKTFSGNIKALNTKCKALFNELDTIAQNASASLKAKINKIKQNIRKMFDTLKTPEVKPPKVRNLREVNPIEQSKSFNSTHRIDADTRVADGYKDGGRRLRFDDNGNPINRPSREIILVDRQQDKKLQDIIAEVKKKTAKMNEKQKAAFLQKYICEISGGTHPDAKIGDIWDNNHIGKEILLGDIITTKPAVAVCRHRSLLYKILGDEVGLRVELQRGNFHDDWGGGGHAWNTVRFEDGTSAIFDAMHNKSSNTTPGHVDDYAKKYFTVDDQQLYADGLSNKADIDGEVEIISVEPAAVSLTPQQRMEMGQISSNINRARTLEDLTKAQQWLDKMPECSQKTALQNQLNSRRAQMKPVDALPEINENELVRVAGNNGRAVDAGYIQASREARGFLNDAIASGEYTQSLDSYIQTMNNMHVVSATGKNGQLNWYSDVGQGGMAINPGNIREGGCSNGRYTEATQIEAIARRYGDPYRVSNQSQRVNLEGIPTEHQPLDINNDAMGYRHYYPDGSSLEKYYYKEMHRTAAEALELINSGASETQILHKIAEHYQYAANARPYGQINNSLFMNEINTLLSKAGMKGMPHGMLDHAAMRLQPETFKKYFADEYRKTAI